MADEQKKYWMKRRRYGWGWIPVTWQGWLLLVVFVAALLANAFRMPKHPTNAQQTQFIVIFIATFAIFMLVAANTSPRPHWRWGKKPTDNPNEDF